jgi:hypothetical protein
MRDGRAMSKTRVSGVCNEFLRGYLIGQAAAYCEMVCRGVRLAGQLCVPPEYADDVSAFISGEECKVAVYPLSDERVTLWIYREKSALALIDDLRSAPTSKVGVWAMGKLFGYADCEVIDFLERSFKSASISESNPLPSSGTVGSRTEQGRSPC